MNFRRILGVVLTVAAVIFVLGSVGAYETATIQFSQCLAQILLGGLLAFVGIFVAHKNYQ